MVFKRGVNQDSEVFGILFLFGFIKNHIIIIFGQILKYEQTIFHGTFPDNFMFAIV